MAHALDNWHSLSFKEQEDLQNKKIEIMVNEVYKYHPAYKKMMKEQNIDPSSINTVDDFIKKFPFTSKKDIAPVDENPFMPDYYIMQKTERFGYKNVFAVDGLIEKIPFQNDFADITTSGHTFGEYMEQELKETERVTKSRGMVIHCPGNNDEDNEKHRFLVEHGYDWSVFEEPGKRMKRKYSRPRGTRT